MIKKLQSEAEGRDSAGEGSSGAGDSEGGSWNGAVVPRGYGDLTRQVELNRCELLNVDIEAAGGVRVLFESNKPSGLGNGAKSSTKDWVESDTDEQLLLFIPFQSMLKLHTLQVRFSPGSRNQPLHLYGSEI